MPDKNEFPSFLKVCILAGYKIPPNMMFNVRFNRTNYIADAQVLYLLSEYFGFTYELYSPKGGYLGFRLPNGSWTGLIGMVQQGICDMALGGLAPTSERSEVVDFIYPYTLTDVTFASDPLQYMPKSFAILHPFSLNMWLALFVSFALMCGVFYVLFRKKKDLVSVVLSLFGILLEGSHSLTSNKNRVRLVWLSWVVGTMFIIHSYKAVLLAFLSFPTLSGVRTITDLSQAARDPSFQCYSYPRSIIYTSLMDYSDESLARIGECVKRHSTVSVKPNNYMRNTTFKKALILGRSFLSSFKNDFIVSEDFFFFSSIAIAVRKGFCCKKVLEDFVHKATAAGIFNKFREDSDFWMQVKTADLAIDQPDAIKQITLDDVTGVFIILIFGLGLSLIVFVLEILFSKKRRQRSSVV